MNQRMWGIKTMTNRQWLLNQMQNMSDADFVEKIDFDAYIGCDHCVFKEACADRDCKVIYCPDCRMNWLKAEHKEQIKLSDAERVILENIDKEYEWIARDRNGYLNVYIGKPTKNKETQVWIWHTDYRGIDVFPNLFQFIKWSDSEPYNIEELLKGE